MTLNDNNGRRRVGMRDDGFGWGMPLVIAAVLILGGLLFFNMGDSRTTTASNERPAVTQIGPAGSQAPAQTPTTTPAPKQ